MMKCFCSATGLPFQETMLTWIPEFVSDWTEFMYYKEWHGTAMMSSRFIYEAMYAVRMTPHKRNSQC